MSSKIVWFYAQEIDYGYNFFDKTTYREIQRIKERSTYGLQRGSDKVTGNVMYDNTLPSLNICMIILWQMSEQVTDTYDISINIGLN
jgi:hypothetical protein